MSRRMLAKVRPLSLQDSAPVRERKRIICPYCGHSNRLSWIARLLARGLKAFTCSKCEVIYLLPMDPDFNPKNVMEISVDSSKAITCRSCRAGFRISECYSQCPCCGQLIHVTSRDLTITLRDNSSAYQDLFPDIPRDVT